MDDKNSESTEDPCEITAPAFSNYKNQLFNIDPRVDSFFSCFCSIICGIGQSSNRIEILEKMIEAGMTIAKIRVCPEEKLLATIDNIKKAADIYGRRIGLVIPVAIALDINTPQIKTGNILYGKKKSVLLEVGQKVYITSDPKFKYKVSTEVIYVGYEDICKFLEENITIYLDNGRITLECLKVTSTYTKCIVRQGGVLGSNKRVFISKLKNFQFELLTEEVRTALKIAIEQELDMVFVPYLPSGDSLKDVRNFLGPEGSNIMLISKIKTPQGIESCNEIIKASDGIVLSRHDVLVQKNFLTQKSITAACNMAGKPVIVANDILFSMIKRNTATMAEMSDLGNAVLDGADCLLLAAETETGKDPIKCVRVAAENFITGQTLFSQQTFFDELSSFIHPPIEITHTIATSAVLAASKCEASAIFVLTTTGRTAHLISKYRPKCPIIAITRHLPVARQMNIFGGVTSLFYQLETLQSWKLEIESRLNFGVSFGKWRQIVNEGDRIILVYSSTRTLEHCDIARIIDIAACEMTTLPCACKDSITRQDYYDY